MNAPLPAQDNLLMSYLDLRKAIGWIGILLPLVVALGKYWFEGPGLEDSISAYYHTIMRNVYVGSLVAMSTFLFSYRGYDDHDARVSKLAALAALVTALFPTAPASGATGNALISSNIHALSASMFFLCLVYFCLVLFRKSSHGILTPRKLLRNRVYSFCGYGLIVCLVLIVVSGFVFDPATSKALHPKFWLESVADVLFGTAWLVKGEAILKDRD
ncbi:MAG: hypothetical protein RL748_1098 [Pseudomonadota bacterium]|jgi:hypothetical protein